MGLGAPAVPLPKEERGLSFVLGTMRHDHGLVCGWARREMRLETSQARFLGLEVSHTPHELLTSALKVRSSSCPSDNTKMTLIVLP